ncbi:MAG TPA: lipid-A-disaccharide synthase [Verrucomicrobiae bacterium]|nr:lipid-A-disaccharide synthase [Verrucomicrobiae bacterium]
MAKFMIIAGEASGDTLGAELVKALQRIPKCERAEFFGAGGPKLADAGVELAFDLAAHAVVGIWEVLKNYGKFKGFFEHLLKLALERKPDVVILIDYPGFNLRFVKALRERSAVKNWRPRIVYYVSPQIWAWHESRVHQIARDVDLMLAIFPFEKDWYRERAPNFRVEFVGHPLVDRYAGHNFNGDARDEVLLLPGSRVRELKKHLPVMIEALQQMRRTEKFVCRMVLPSESLRSLAQEIAPLDNIEVQIGGLADALLKARVAIASSGTVTMECAYFRVPTVVLYRTSWSTHALGRRFIKVKYLAMPNLLAGERVYPEFIQDEASGANLARTALELMKDEKRRATIKTKLNAVIASLGETGASDRAARYVADLITC